MLRNNNTSLESVIPHSVDNAAKMCILDLDRPGTFRGPALFFSALLLVSRGTVEGWKAGECIDMDPDGGLVQSCAHCISLNFPL
jgi:hypothetical protein